MDDRLTSAILGGAEIALFENAYAAYSGEAQRIALAFLGEPQLAMDAVHNAFLEILRHLLKGGRWSDPAEARAVVLRNTRWAALKLLRTRRRQREQSGPPPDREDETTWARWEARALCEQVVARLPEHQQHALRLHFEEGLPNPEAAARLGLTTWGYASLLQRAIAAARRAARGYGLLPALVGYWSRTRRIRHSHGRVRRHRPCQVSAGLAKVTATAAVAILAVHTVQLMAPMPADQPPARAVSMSIPVPADLSGRRLSAGDETMADVVVVDVTLSATSHPAMVLALGCGRQCRCWVVSQSADAGGRWTLAEGPDASSPKPRLHVAQGYPDDSRIVVTDGAGLEMRQWVTRRIGLGFEPLRSAITVDQAIHARPCDEPGSRTACRSRRTASALKAVDHLLVFPATGGVLCSPDGGLSWRQACSIGAS